MRNRLLVWAFRTAWNLLPKVPDRFSSRIAQLLADFAWLRNGQGVRQLERNLARVTGLSGEALRLKVRDGIRAYSEYWRILFRIPGWELAQMQERVVLHDIEHVDHALALGKGVVLAATHSGNWDLAGIVVAERFDRILTVAERLEPEALFNAFAQHRESYGIEIVPHRGGSRSPMEVLEERLESGGVVALVSDRDLSRRGIDVDFFGLTARMAAGPAALALKTGAALVACAQWVEGDIVHVRAHPAIVIDNDSTIESVTQDVANVFAADIAAHPVDWHMLQVVWREDMRS